MLYQLHQTFPQRNLFKSHPYATLGTNQDLTASASSGDIDGDGDLDIIVANGRHWSQQNQIFYNDGKGFFRRSMTLGSEQNTTYQVPLADIDNDGDLDILLEMIGLKIKFLKMMVMGILRLIIILV